VAERGTRIGRRWNKRFADRCDVCTDACVWRKAADCVVCDLVLF
jgi:hypothetical protein